jgi:hypothetical protein
MAVPAANDERVLSGGVFPTNVSISTGRHGSCDPIRNRKSAAVGLVLVRVAPPKQRMEAPAEGSHEYRSSEWDTVATMIDLRRGTRRGRDRLRGKKAGPPDGCFPTKSTVRRPNRPRGVLYLIFISRDGSNSMRRARQKGSQITGKVSLGDGIAAAKEEEG